MPPKQKAKSKSKPHVAMLDFPVKLQGSAINDNVYPTDFDLPLHK